MSGSMGTFLLLKICCSRFCFRSCTPSSSRRRRSSAESSPEFLYLLRCDDEPDGAEDVDDDMMPMRGDWACLQRRRE